MPPPDKARPTRSSVLWRAPLWGPGNGAIPACCRRRWIAVISSFLTSSQLAASFSSSIVESMGLLRQSRLVNADEGCEGPRSLERKERGRRIDFESALARINSLNRLNSGKKCPGLRRRRLSARRASKIPNCTYAGQKEIGPAAHRDKLRHTRETPPHAVWLG